MNAEWALVTITGIYVVATIFICAFNLRSAKAIEEQNKEQKRQFDETNCPCVDVTLEVIKGGLVCLKIQNTGQRMAHNVKVKMNKEFIEQIKNDSDKNSMNNFLKSSYSLGIGQKWFLFLCSHIELNRLNKIPIHLNVSYEYDNKTITKDFIIDLEQYNWMLIYDSPTQDISDSAKKIVDIMKQIQNEGIKIEAQV